jgi:hypothetical protein
MKKEIYLTKKLKVKYDKDFLNVLNCKDKFWQVDIGLIEPLSRVNNNRYVHTLYSKKGLEDRRSYLYVCYSSRVEKQIFREIIPKMVEQFNIKNEAISYYVFSAPRDNREHNEEAPPVGIGCKDDKDYFRVNFVELYLETGRYDITEKWWSYLIDSLATIKPEQ